MKHMCRRMCLNWKQMSALRLWYVLIVIICSKKKIKDFNSCATWVKWTKKSLTNNMILFIFYSRSPFMRSRRSNWLDNKNKMTRLVHLLLAALAPKTSDGITNHWMQCKHIRRARMREDFDQTVANLCIQRIGHVDVGDIDRIWKWKWL